MKNWTLEAASAVVKHVDYFSEISTSQVQDIIAKHCPFKPDVAYMPVPRCETCAHWFEFPPHPDTGQRAGQCEKIYVRTDVKEIKGVVHYVKKLLPTMNDFGCVQWKEKA